MRCDNHQCYKGLFSYENPPALAESAAIADILSGRRLQLGISRGSPETVERGYETWGILPADGETDADMARRHAQEFLSLLRGEGLAVASGSPTDRPVLRPIRPMIEVVSQRVWWGAGTRRTAQWAARLGMNLMSSTLLTEDTGVPFAQAQAEQIRLFREEFALHNHGFEPRVAVTRTIIPITDERANEHFGLQAQIDSTDHVGQIDGEPARMGRSYIGEPDALLEALRRDEAIAAADTLLVTVPNQLGLDFNVSLLRSIAKDLRPALGW